MYMYMYIHVHCLYNPSGKHGLRASPEFSKKEHLRSDDVQLVNHKIVNSPPQWAHRCPIHLCLCVCTVRVWCVGSGFSFFSSFMTNLASVIYTCNFMYIPVCGLWVIPLWFSASYLTPIPVLKAGHPCVL